MFDEEKNQPSFSIRITEPSVGIVVALSSCFQFLTYEFIANTQKNPEAAVNRIL